MNYLTLSLVCVLLSACLSSCIRYEHATPMSNADRAQAQRIDQLKRLIERGDMREAQNELTSAFNDGYQHPMAYYFQGLIYFTNGSTDDFIRSIPWFEKAIAASPQWLEPRLYLARACMKDKRYQRALQVFIEIDQLAPHSAVGPYGQAIIASINGSTASAIHQCSEALLRNPVHQATLLLRARLATRQNNAAEEQHYYQRLVSADPLQAEAHAALARIALGNGRLAEAQRSFERSYQLNPRNDIARQLADIATLQHNDSARAHWLHQAGVADEIAPTTTRPPQKNN